MRKRIVLVVVVLVVLGILTAAAPAVPQGPFSPHIRLHGLGPTHSLLFAGMTPQATVTPKPTAAIHIHLSGGPRVQGRAGSGPNVPIAAGGWSCDIWQQAWAWSSTVMAGYASYSCSETMFDVKFNQYADYCAPLLWGCTWQTKTTFAGCEYINAISGTCPSGVGVNYQNVSAGQLWRERSVVCAYPYGDQTSDCGPVAVQVQF